MKDLSIKFYFALVFFVLVIFYFDLYFVKFVCEVILFKWLIKLFYERRNQNT